MTNAGHHVVDVRGRPNRVSAVFAVTVLAGVSASMVWGRAPDPWAVTHLGMTYDLGLIPRGLWGTVLDLVGLMPGRPAAAALVTFMLVVVMVGLGVSRLLSGVERSEGSSVSRRALVITCVLLSPAGFPFLAAEMGRLDAVVIALTVLAVLVATHRGRCVPFAVAALVVTAIMVHEAAVLVTAPLAATVLTARHGRTAGAATLTLGVATAALLVLRPMPVPQPEFSTWLASRVDRADVFATLVPYQGLGSATSRAWSHVMGLRWSDWAALGMAVLAPALIAARALLGRRPTTVPVGPLVAAAIAPLMLAALGTDLTRWTSMATLGVAGVAAALTPPGQEATAFDRGLVALALGTTLVLGPLAV